MKKSQFLNIAQISTGTIEVPNNFSICIYVQGCKIRCPGCHNSHLWNFDGGTKIDVGCIPNIIDDYPMCDWVCWLGGEPLDQLDGVKDFTQEFKRLGKKVCLYTGYQFQNINVDLLRDVDMVVDGSYIEKLGPVTQKGTNQKIWRRSSPNCWNLISDWDLLKLFDKEIVNNFETSKEKGE